MDFELVAEGFEFPEGPIAMNDGSVILTEIKAQRLTRVYPDGRKETVVNTGGGPNGAAMVIRPSASSRAPTAKVALVKRLSASAVEASGS